MQEEVRLETPPVPREENCDANFLHAHNNKQAQVKADL
jgi:hypothetical protein